jgi:thiamine biosynthesis lipoprotein
MPIELGDHIGMKLPRVSTFRSAVAAACCALVATHCWGPRPQKNLKRFEFVQPHMGTVFRIVFYASDDPSAQRAAQAAFSRIAELDHIMSDYQASSELMQLCRRAGGPPVQVSEDLYRVLNAAQEIARESDGAFDITVGPLVRLWRRARRQHELPERARLGQALALVGYQKLRLDARTHTAQLLKSGMLLDLGGIAKGYAADETLGVLKRHGIDRALVAGGGDIAVSQEPPDNAGTGWRIAVASLDSPKEKPNRYVALRDGGISTSGDLEQHVEIDGTRYSHIVNPKTGRALTGRSSVTVLARNGMTADALATAVSVLGMQRGLELVKSISGTAALICQSEKDAAKCADWQFPPPSDQESTKN